MYSVNRKFLYPACLLFCCAMAPAVSYGSGHPELAIAAIPAALLKDADAVLRDEQVIIEVAGIDEVIVTRSRTVSLLNDAAARQTHLATYNSELQSVHAVSATVYDASGKEIEHAGRKEFRDFPLNIGSAMFSDIVLKRYDVKYAGYPFTITFTERFTLHHTFLLPDWSPQSDDNNGRIAIMKAGLTVIAPKAAGIRQKSLGGMPEPAISGDTLRWQLSGIPAKKHEALAVTNAFTASTVLLAADTFSLGSFKGNNHSWKELGAFIYRLNSGKDVLSPEDKAYVQGISAATSDRHSLIKALYKHMQQRCRYVSVQLGIGGWQTLPASSVGNNQYGDCKGLSNYMMSMLAAAGIDAYPVLIDAGPDYRPLQHDFPVSLFNHEILCVPDDADTLWLECTSVDNAAGYLGSFTEDRDALMITRDGGVLVHTPSLSENQSFIHRHIRAEAREGGQCILHLSATHSGYLHDILYRNIVNHTNDEVAHYASHKFSLPSYTVDSFRYERASTDSIMPAMQEEALLTVDGLLSKSNARIFLNMNLMPLELPAIASSAQRTTSFRLSHSYTMLDDFEIAVPKNYSPENIPHPVKLSGPFGTFECQILIDAANISLHRKLVIKAGVYDAAYYSSFASFMEQVAGATNYRIILHVQ